MRWLVGWVGGVWVFRSLKKAIVDLLSLPRSGQADDEKGVEDAVTNND